MFGLSELAVFLVVVVVVLGIRRLPGLTRSAGKATRIFKSEARALRDQDEVPPGSVRVVAGTVVERDEPRP
ncbi:twin-arginine translocase TatA/TatE family subunit [Streptomyces sp. LP11]|uniref:Twin-arginine translocase TatA/TatE family subunit n=1 Tax=Streptomyces pyxinicus TaxID=2970331 RepID=A0ABT2B8Q7_9ACTN|nr:twin-arginine translocase TatA/TatE family subunit [Streptomyces sp. LP11]MCS0604902.1 twin-arginine translocase TatA/TatE family subunit [Streptomyces sp. LP11]